jgi:hypothetical protein
VSVEQAGQRRTVGYFIEQKFERPEVLEELRKYGFREGNYRRIIVTWGATPEAHAAAEQYGILVWDWTASRWVALAPLATASFYPACGALPRDPPPTRPIRPRSRFFAHCFRRVGTGKPRSRTDLPCQKGLPALTKE